MTSSSRPWWVGPAILLGAALLIYTAPQRSAEAVRSVAGQAGEFVGAVLDGMTLPEDPQ